MKIYFAPNSRAVRIVWLFEELGLPYELEQFKLGEKRMREDDYKKVHPMGRVPALEDGDVTIFESGAIVEYILARHGEGRMRPAPDSVDFPMYLDLYQQKKLDLDGLVTRTYSIDEAPEAFADLESGKNARGVIVY